MNPITAHPPGRTRSPATAAARLSSSSGAPVLSGAVRSLVLFVIMAVVGVLFAPGRAHAAREAVFSQDFQSLAIGEPWADGSVHGKLNSVFNGYGSVGVVRDDTRVLSIAPQASTSPDETHAALVTSVASFEDLELRARMKTVRQLRRGDPNPWEVGWVVWNYKDNTHFYYLILKPNGWELGKADPAYPGAQRFLATGSNRTFPIGTWNTVRIRQINNTMRVSANGERLVKLTDEERPYRRGSVGFYTEDARVNFDNIAVRRL